MELFRYPTNIDRPDPCAILKVFESEGNSSAYPVGLGLVHKGNQICKSDPAVRISPSNNVFEASWKQQPVKKNS